MILTGIEPFLPDLEYLLNDKKIAENQNPLSSSRLKKVVAGTGQLSNLLLADFIALSRLQVVV